MFRAGSSAWASPPVPWWAARSRPSSGRHSQAPLSHCIRELQRLWSAKQRGAVMQAKVMLLKRHCTCLACLLLMLIAMHTLAPFLHRCCSAIGFPLGLILIVFCGGDLFTGNCFYSLVAWLEGEQGVVLCLTPGCGHKWAAFPSSSLRFVATAHVTHRTLRPHLLPWRSPPAVCVLVVQPGWLPADGGPV